MKSKMAKADKRARKRDNKQMARAEREAAAKRAKQKSGLIRGGIVGAVIIGGIALILTLGGKDPKKATSTTKPAATTTSTLAMPAGCVKTKPPAAAPKTYTAAPAMTIDKTKTYTATMTTSCGTITIGLDAANAPVATNNFVFLARAHFYDGLTWHRVVKDFVIQSGDPKGDGSGGPGYTVKGEPPKDGYQLGSLAAAKGSADPDGTMGSQFFIVTGKNGASLPSQYARFGKVTKGLDVAQKLESLSVGDGPPSQPLYIFKVTISES